VLLTILLAVSMAMYFLYRENISQFFNDRETIVDHFASLVLPKSLVLMDYFIWAKKSIYKTLFLTGSPFYAGVVLNLLLLIYGAYFIFRHKRKMFFLYLISPVVFLILASSVMGYPTGGRPVLFYIPILLIFISIACSAAFRRDYLLGLLIVLFIFVTPIRMTLGNFINPHSTVQENVRASVEFIKNNVAPGDSLYVYEKAKPMYDYYSAKPSNKKLKIVLNSEVKVFSNSPEKFLKSVEERRVWVLFSHTWRLPGGVGEFTSYLDQAGRRVAEKKSRGGAVYLYEFT